MKLINRFAIAMLVAIVTTASYAQTADQILAKYFENTGGLENWKKVKTVKASGKYAFGPQEFPFEMEMKYPGLMRININVQGQQIVQASDGTVAWMINPFQGGTSAQKLPDDQAKEFLEQRLESEFIDYKQKGHEVTLEGEEDVDGVKCFKIKLVKNKNNDKEDVTEYHYFDKENYVPIMMATFVRSGPAQGTESRQYYSDYQEVDGLMMAFFVETKVNGQTLQKITYEKYVVNQPVDDSIFAFPK